MSSSTWQEAHHPVIQKEVDELLAKGAIEPSSGGAGFYSNIFVVPKHTGGLCPILLKGLARPDHRQGSNSQYRRDLCQGLCQGLVGHLCLNGLT